MRERDEAWMISVFIGMRLRRIMEQAGSLTKQVGGGQFREGLSAFSLWGVR